jgi:endo-1,4-beta-xylanase
VFALVLGCGAGAIACSADETPSGQGTSGGAGGSLGGRAGLTDGGGAASGGTAVSASGGMPAGGTANSSTAGARSTSGGNNTFSGGTSGSVAGAGGTGVNNTAGTAVGGSAPVAGMGGRIGGGGVGGTNAGGKASGGTMASGGAGGRIGGGGAGASSGGSGGASPIGEPDCNAQMPAGGTMKSGNGNGGSGNLAWQIWSNTGMGELTHYDVPAFIATWNNSGGYLGRLGFEWGGFMGSPVPHAQRGTIKAQFVSKKTGSAGGYSYIGMYGWTTDPCVEWYVVDDSFNTMPINPGTTTKKGEVQLDGGTYIVYTRPTTGSGGTRCSGVTDWIQHYSVRKTARACGVISLSEHFKAWEGLGMDMSGALLEASILVEVGGGVGNVQLPIANVVVQ